LEFREKNMELLIPGGPKLHLHHLVCDYNGTLAKDGELKDGVAERFALIAKFLQIYVITADTHGTVALKLNGLPCQVEIIGPERQDEEKLAFVEQLEGDGVIAVGNGRNDCLMLKRAALGIGLIQEEGACAAIVPSADILCHSIVDCLDLLLHPARLIATLRN
jgi:P-type E1-E2 ATPase